MYRCELTSRTGCLRKELSVSPSHSGVTEVLMPLNLKILQFNRKGRTTFTDGFISRHSQRVKNPTQRICTKEVSSNLSK